MEEREAPAVWDAQSYPSDGLAVKRDLICVKRDLISVKRDLVRHWDAQWYPSDGLVLAQIFCESERERQGREGERGGGGGAGRGRRQVGVRKRARKRWGQREQERDVQCMNPLHVHDECVHANRLHYMYMMSVYTQTDICPLAFSISVFLSRARSLSPPPVHVLMPVQTRPQP